MTSVLVIDSNSAVQAITTLALNQTDCKVEALSDAAQAIARIRSLRPDVVLCAKEIQGADPFRLCQMAKAEFPNMFFVLLAPSEGVKQTTNAARDAGYDEVIFKPFKSNRLREVVFGLLSAAPKSDKLETTYYVASSDGLRKAILERFLERYGAKKLETAPTKEQSTAIFISDNKELIPADFSGKAFGLGAVSGITNQIKLPLTEEGLKEVFTGLLKEIESPPLSAAEPVVPELDRSELAAEISARIFKRLLLSDSFKDGNWAETATIIEQELRAAKASKS